MANGNVARLLPSAATPAVATADSLAAISTETLVEIGNLVVQAAGAMFLGAEKYLAGQSTLPTSMQVGELIARLYFLQQATPNFAAIVIREGRRTLQATLPPDVAAHGDLDEVLSWPLTVLARVTEAERAFAGRMQ